jgi:ectoine hydroxylase
MVMTVLTPDFELPTIDDYPTRKDNTPALLYRKDPVVWGAAGDGPLADADLAGYDERGYLSVEELLTPDEVKELRAEARRLRGDTGSDGDPRVVAEDGEVRTVFEAHSLSEVFGKLARDPRILDRVRQILGSDVYVYQSRLNRLPGFSGTDAFWHSDFETWHAEDGMPRIRAVSVSISLSDNYEHNGALMILPGSHKTFVSCADEAEGDHSSPGPDNGEVGTPDEGSVSILTELYGIDVVTGPAGQAVIADANCMHGFNGNISPHPRSDFFIVYNSVENACEEPYSAEEPRPGFLSARDTTPLT